MQAICAELVPSMLYCVTTEKEADGTNCTDDPNVGFCVDGSCDFDLPVELMNFSAISQGNEIMLDWTTATEESNAGFGIEVSLDGDSFREVGFVAGAGNSLKESSYTYRVTRLAAGLHYVRLRYDDFDGESGYSDVIEVRSEVPGKFALNPAYPNPFNPQTTIGFSVDADMDVQLTVVNSCGKEVARLFDGRAEAQVVNEFQFNADILPSGTYFYRLDTPAGSQMRSMTLVK